MKRTVWIVPHTHYDAEVFIPEKETLEIGYANMLGALGLMRSSPEFKFALDQTCFIEPFLKTYPEERAFFQQMIDQGRLEITCGMYSMPDVNIPSGESFIRQVLEGKGYCERELGVDPRCGWTIDSFGHHPQFPQLMAKCGFDHAVFQRLMEKGSPSEFIWEGIDSTRLLCHWMPRGYGIFYGAPGNPHEFARFARERIAVLQAHAVTPHLLAMAGADLTPVEPQLVEMIDAYNHSQEDGELRLATPAEFFAAIKRAGLDFATITGDLNPVFQGCYSARIDVKQWNRRLETRLVDAEKWDAVAQRMGSFSQSERLAEAWRPVLFNQFHDIICGSHVDVVFEHTLDRYKYSLSLSEAALEASLEAIADQIDTAGEGIPAIVYNSLAWERSDAVECPVAFSEKGTFELAVIDSIGRLAPCDLLQTERYPDGSLKRARLLFIARDVPALGYEVYRILPAALTSLAESDLSTSHPYGPGLRLDLDHGWLENRFYRLEFDLWSGVLTRLYDKTNEWEVILESRSYGNTVVKERDFGNFWQYNGPCKGDALNPTPERYPLPELDDPRADFAHLTQGDGLVRPGRAMAEFSISHPFGAGQYATRLRLYAGLPRVDIQTSLVNGDERVRYRAAIPTSIQGGTITCEIPFGAIQRPEGEYPAQNWIDYACTASSTSPEHGITLLNRGLPGNNVADGVMMLSLLKCTALKEGYGEFKLEDATRQGYEIGKPHTFDYALVTHDGDWRAGQVYRRGAEFNHPLVVWKPRLPVRQRSLAEASTNPGLLPARMSFLQVEGKSVVLSAVKAFPDGMIVRVYEAEGQPVETASLELAWPVQAAFEVNLVEKEEKTISLDSPARRLSFALKPFEIKTFKLVF